MLKPRVNQDPELTCGQFESGTWYRWEGRGRRCSLWTRDPGTPRQEVRDTPNPRTFQQVTGSTTARAGHSGFQQPPGSRPDRHRGLGGWQASVFLPSFLGGSRKDLPVYTPWWALSRPGGPPPASQLQRQGGGGGFGLLGLARPRRRRPEQASQSPPIQWNFITCAKCWKETGNLKSMAMFSFCASLVCVFFPAKTNSE